MARYLDDARLDFRHHFLCSMMMFLFKRAAKAMLRNGR